MKKKQLQDARIFHNLIIVDEIKAKLKPIIRQYPWYLLSAALNMLADEDDNGKLRTHANPKKGKTVKSTPKTPKAKAKVKKVMKEFKEGDLHSGSKKGPKVKSRKQAVAIALNEARKGKK